MDNTSWENVRKAPETILTASNGQVKVLICNAGIMAIPDLQLSKDGFDLQLAPNHLAHFLLLNILQLALLGAVTPELPSRLIVVAS